MIGLKEEMKIMKHETKEEMKTMKDEIINELRSQFNPLPNPTPIINPLIANGIQNQNPNTISNPTPSRMNEETPEWLPPLSNPINILTKKT